MAVRDLPKVRAPVRFRYSAQTSLFVIIFPYLRDFLVLGLDFQFQICYNGPLANEPIF